MKFRLTFRLKIFFLCISIYLITLTITGIVVTNKTYNVSLNKEINRCLKEQTNIYRNSILYLLVNEKQYEQNSNVKKYVQRIVSMFEDEDSHIEIYNKYGKILAPNESIFDFNRKDELASALKGKKNYILRRENDKHYVCINQEFQIGNKEFVLSYIKDITDIDVQKKQQGLFFFEVGIIGFILIAIITSFISKILIKPIENLTDVTYNISKGNYKDRVYVKNRDEIGMLALRFNKMADEIESKITQLQQESQKKQRFIDNLAHELRTPLTSIIGYAELLIKIKYNEETFHKGLNYIYSEGSRMLKLVDTLMKMIITREDPLCILECDITSMLIDIAYIMNIKAKEKNIEIDVLKTNIKLNLDKDLIKGVIINLIDNSIKASRVNSKIEIGSKVGDDGKYIYVKDYGKGMQKEQIDKIIEPFYRVDKSRSRKEGGVGLGLALCNEIIKRHNAELKIDSKINVGTIVRIIFK